MPVRFSINFSIYISVRVDRAEKTLRPGLVVGRQGAPRLLQLRTGGHLRGPQRRRDRFARGLPSQRTDVGVCQLLRARPSLLLNSDARGKKSKSLMFANERECVDIVCGWCVVIATV